jgi:hypothetical protein
MDSVKDSAVPPDALLTQRTEIDRPHVSAASPSSVLPVTLTKPCGIEQKFSFEGWPLMVRILWWAVRNVRQ